MFGGFAAQTYFSAKKYKTFIFMCGTKVNKALMNNFIKLTLFKLFSHFNQSCDILFAFFISNICIKKDTITKFNKENIPVETSDFKLFVRYVHGNLISFVLLIMKFLS